MKIGIDASTVCKDRGEFRCNDLKVITPILCHVCRMACDAFSKGDLESGHKYAQTWHQLVTDQLTKEKA